MSNPTAAQIQSMPAPKLKQTAKNNKVSTEGSVDDIRKRLIKHFAAGSKAAPVKPAAAAAPEGGKGGKTASPAKADPEPAPAAAAAKGGKGGKGGKTPTPAANDSDPNSNPAATSTSGKTGHAILVERVDALEARIAALESAAASDTADGEPDAVESEADAEDLLAEWRNDETGFLQLTPETPASWNLAQLQAFATECEFEYPAEAKGVPKMRAFAKAKIEENMGDDDDLGEVVEGPNGERAYAAKDDIEGFEAGNEIYVELEGTWYLCTVNDEAYSQDADGDRFLSCTINEDGNAMDVFPDGVGSSKVIGFVAPDAE